MYLLTLQIDPAVTTGRFSDGSVAFPDPLLTSMHWVRLRVTPPATEPNSPLLATFDVETENWKDLKKADSLFLPKPDPQVIGVYVTENVDAHPTTSTIPSTAKLELAVCFGRPVKARQTRSSPISEMTSSGLVVKPTFIFGPTSARTTPHPTIAGYPGRRWFFELGKIAERPVAGSNFNDRYEFAVGAVLRNGTSLVRYYGEDPEMDVGEN